MKIHVFVRATIKIACYCIFCLVLSAGISMFLHSYVWACRWKGYRTVGNFSYGHSLVFKNVNRDKDARVLEAWEIYELLIPNVDEDVRC